MPEVKRCPFQTGRDCFEGGCELWEDGYCAFTSIALSLCDILSILKDQGDK